MLRFIIMILYLLIAGIISLPLYAFRFIQRRKHPEQSARGSQRTVVHLLDVFVFLSGTKVIVKGLENVPSDVPVLYVGNHRSIFDIIIGYHYVKNNTGFIAKDSMKHTPIISTWMRLINCLFLNRTDIKEGLKTIKQAIELVQNGTSVFIFPEGTRSLGDELLPFKEGSLKIAEKGKCPVVPVAITGTEEIFDNHVPKIKPAVIVYEFGQPIDLQNLDKETKKHSGAYVRDIIINMRAGHPDIIDSMKNEKFRRKELHK